MSLALNELSKSSGALFVVAAGNNGEAGTGTVGSPGAADEALTVGAVDRDDSLASFSSRGPRLGDDAVKPDVTAPGDTLDNTDNTHGVFGAFDSFTVFDARVQYRIDEHLTAGVGVDNLNDRRYFLYHPFPQRTWVADLRLSL